MTLPQESVCTEQGCSRRVKARGLCAKHYRPVTTYPPEHLKPAEVRRLLEAAGQGRSGVRNQALVWLLYRSGLRISEALALRPHDVDLEEGTVFVRRGKGSKSRTVGIDESAFPALRAWLAVRPKSDLLFCTETGRPIMTSYVRALFARLGRAAGIAKRCHAHMLRHTLAVEMLKEGLPIEYIRQQLGHSSLAVTANYLSSLSPRETIDAVRKRKLAWEAE